MNVHPFPFSPKGMKLSWWRAKDNMQLFLSAIVNFRIFHNALLCSLNARDLFHVSFANCHELRSLLKEHSLSLKRQIMSIRQGVWASKLFVSRDIFKSLSLKNFFLYFFLFCLWNIFIAPKDKTSFEQIKKEEYLKMTLKLIVELEN